MRLLLNLLLAAMWAGFTGQLTVQAFSFGLVLGYLVLLLLEPVLGQPAYHGWVWRTLVFLALYVRDFIAASLRVAHDVLTPRFRMKPGVVRIPLDARTDLEITVFANLISLAPGTLCLDVSRDRSELYVHIMYIDVHVDRQRHQIKERLERRVLGLLRGPEPRPKAQREVPGEHAAGQHAAERREP